MISYSAPPIYSGAGRQATLLARKLRERDILVTMVTAHHRKDLATRETREGIEVVRLPVTRSRRTRAFSFSLVAAALIVHQRRHIDIVHIHGAYWRIVPVILATKGDKIKNIVKMTLYGTDDPSSIASRRFGSVLLAALRGTDAVIATTGEMARSYREAALPAEKLRRIPNGVDAEHYRPATDQGRHALRQLHGVPVSAPVVLFSGWVHPRKGVDLLLSAWVRVKEQVPNAILLLVGPEGISGASRQQGEQFADVQKNYDVVSVGQQDDVRPYYQMADVFILPTRLEGMSNALLEAMSSGLPAVTTNIAGSSEVITENVDGLLVEPESEDAIVEVLVQLLHDPGCRYKLGRQARRTIVNRFSIETVADRYAELYHDLMGRN